MRLKIAVLAPMPRARVRIAVVAKAGDHLWNWRRAKRQSERLDWNQFSIRCMRIMPKF